MTCVRVRESDCVCRFVQIIPFYCGATVNWDSFSWLLSSLSAFTFQQLHWWASPSFPRRCFFVAVRLCFGRWRFQWLWVFLRSVLMIDGYFTSTSVSSFSFLAGLLQSTVLVLLGHVVLIAFLRILMFFVNGGVYLWLPVSRYWFDQRSLFC